MGNPPLDEKAIFQAACRIESLEARSDYLARVCGDDTALLERIAALLRVHDDEPSFLESPPPVLVGPVGPTQDPPIAECPGTLIGRYKLLELIGEGGMGLVYMAEQQEPVRRKVALTIIKLGMDTKAVIGRFEAERQALALMDHPNIAKILDAGATESGRPYFVMDLVRGIPVTEYCDQNELTTKERLGIFTDVCQAVQHAHQKGIIHRDLKPTNVLVTQQDGRPVPKIIDFGISKATEQRLTEKTHFTEHRQLVGTPEYMSPEQATFCDADVDTRSDIYSLGVLLYELLVGSTPFDAQELRSRGYDEICRVIRESDAPTPSKRLSTLGDAVSEISKQRHAEPAALRKLLRGDLDWIVMKCLEKERVRRYETVHGLARDVERHLSDEPVRARPPSAVYRLKKIVRKYRLRVAAAAMIFASLTFGLVLAAAALIRINQERQVARAERDQARYNLHLARQLIRDALVPASDRLGVIADPADVQRTNADLLEKAIWFYEQIIEKVPDDSGIRLELAQVCRQRAGLAFMTGQAGEPFARRSISLLKSLVECHPDNAHYRDELAKSHYQLADLHLAQLRYKDAAQHYRVAIKTLEDLIERFPTDSDLRERHLETQGSLASVLQWVSEHDAAEHCYRRALEVQGRAGAGIRRRFALLLMKMNRYDDAERTLEEARRIMEQLEPVSFQEEVLGDYWMAEILRGLGELSYHCARPQTAEEYLRRAVDIGQMRIEAVRSSDWGYETLGWAYHHLSETLVQQDRLDEAEQAAHRARQMWEAISGRIGRQYEAMASIRLGELRHQRGDADKAHAHFQRAKEHLEEISRALRHEPLCQKRFIVLLAHCPDPDFRDPRRAVEIAQRVKTDSDGALWRYLALGQYRSGDWAGAKNSIERSMELRAGGDPLDWILLAMAQWQLGNHDAAVQVYARAEEAISSGTPILYLDLGVLGFQRLRAEAANLFESGTASSSDLPFTGRLGTVPCLQNVPDAVCQSSERSSGGRQRCKDTAKHRRGRGIGKPGDVLSTNERATIKFAVKATGASQKRA